MFLVSNQNSSNANYTQIKHIQGTHDYHSYKIQYIKYAHCKCNNIYMLAGSFYLFIHFWSWNHFWENGLEKLSFVRNTTYFKIETFRLRYKYKCYKIDQLLLIRTSKYSLLLSVLSISLKSTPQLLQWWTIRWHTNT